ncbi:carboxymuconolactone decarboxylase family protein [Chryseobacterium ginsengisoli]
MITSNEQLSIKDKSIITISSYTAQGKLTNLKTELNKGLEAGLTINEIKEIIIHSYAYCGFPRSIRGLQTFMEVLEERKAKGITDKQGAESSPIASENSKYERGKKILGKLTGIPQPDKLSGYSAFAPTIDTFLKEHLFADIFERDVLTYAQRELVTISVIAAIGNAEPMLQGHLGISLNVGWSQKQLEEFIKVISTTISKQKSGATGLVLKKVLESTH